eukprot:TRINITY_DN3113_c0_g1_i6.p4 TRINITY_DN3113_c0_g1~~TRINITY_DN3113_c0_g1_i6.p4  ORF type:complete len:137 (+),score=45.83 TRINITY_DN3113_c0_g1_i6:2223-2633(+)
MAETKIDPFYWELIFKSLREIERKPLPMVCKTFRDLLSRDVENLTDIKDPMGREFWKKNFKSDSSVELEIFLGKFAENWNIPPEIPPGFHQDNYFFHPLLTQVGFRNCNSKVRQKIPPAHQKCRQSNSTIFLVDVY